MELLHRVKSRCFEHLEGILHNCLCLCYLYICVETKISSLNSLLICHEHQSLLTYSKHQYPPNKNLKS